MPSRLDGLTDETRDQLAEVALNLSGNQKTRKGFLGLLKEASPATPIPEIDAVSAAENLLKGEREAREKFEKEQRDRWLAEDLAKRKTEVRTKFGLSDEDMSNMEKMMTEKQLPADYTWAAQIYKQQNEVAAPTNYGQSGYGPLDLEHNAKQFEGLMEDTDNWASRTAHQMIDDMQKKGRAPAF